MLECSPEQNTNKQGGEPCHSSNEEGGAFRLTQTKGIKAKGVRRPDAEVSIEDISLALWLGAKRKVRERRANEAKAKARRERRELDRTRKRKRGEA